MKLSLKLLTASSILLIAGFCAPINLQARTQENLNEIDVYFAPEAAAWGFPNMTLDSEYGVSIKFGGMFSGKTYFHLKVVPSEPFEPGTIDYYYGVLIGRYKKGTNAKVQLYADYYSFGASSPSSSTLVASYDLNTSTDTYGNWSRAVVNGIAYDIKVSLYVRPDEDKDRLYMGRKVVRKVIVYILPNKPTTKSGPDRKLEPKSKTDKEDL